MEKKDSRLTKRIVAAMVLGGATGIALGILAPEVFHRVNQTVFEPVGQLFIRSIQMLVVPIVFFSLLVGAAGISDPKRLGRIGGKTILFYLFTTSIAITIGLLLGNLFTPGAGIDIVSDTLVLDIAESPSFLEVLVNIVPENPIRSMVEGDMLSVIFFALLMGIALAQTKIGQEGEQLYQIGEALSELFMKMINMIMQVAPFGVFALMASTTGGQGYDVLTGMVKYMVLILGGLFLHAGGTYVILLKGLGKVSPILFYRQLIRVLLMGFSTSSSSATLPLTIRNVETQLGVSQKITGFVLPLGATINMDGTAMMQGLATIFIAQAYNIDLSFGQQVTVVVIAVLASIGTAGVPGVGIITLSMVLQSVGLPVEGIGLILGVDRLIDMFRTATNIAGDATVAIVVARGEGELDDTVFSRLESETKNEPQNPFP